ncbi:MAG: GntR family transcriptional regulator [Caulobacteraceae bacterium]|nr:GntR family transcriptional regulator [Caulobacteraceae bacterium]
MNSLASLAAVADRISVSGETRKTYAFDVLRKAIVTGVYKPGVRMNESQLSRELNISRIPIREALVQLQGQGLVTNHPRRGMFVTELTAGDVSRINSLRVVLEAEALRLCRSHMTADLQLRLTDLVERMEAWDERSSIDAAQLDLEFHRSIWRASDNPYLYDSLDSLTTVLFAFTALDKVSHDDEHWRLNHHRDLLNFLLGHSDQAAESAIVDHLSRYYDDPAVFSSYRPARRG